MPDKKDQRLTENMPHGGASGTLHAVLGRVERNLAAKGINPPVSAETAAVCAAVAEILDIAGIKVDDVAEVAAPKARKSKS